MSAEGSEMKLVEVEDAIGQVLCHDMTRIVKGVCKGPVFRKGHIVTKEDIPMLLSIGKEHVYIWENDETTLHENDAAGILRDICMGSGMSASEPKEGKIELKAEMDGVLTCDREKLVKLNSLGEIMVASRHADFPVRKGDKILGTRVIPLVIKKEKMEEAKRIGGDEPIFNVVPYKHMKVGVVTTGSEVFKGRIQDTFTPVIEQKLAEYGSEMGDHVTLSDDDKEITSAIKGMLEEGMDAVVCTGGMSVDPDDRTPLAIRNSGARIISYGAPVLPGAMFLLSYADDGRPVMGLPGCVMYSKRTIFDLVLPRILAGVRISKRDLDALGEGGFCLSCDVCTFPNCGFGK